MANVLESSLHCIICFDEFDLNDRPPVVLPCGHTYVCKVCAKKINRCMECREPLYWTPPAQTTKIAPTSHIHRSPVPTGRTYAAARNARLGIGAPQTPPHPSTVQKEEPIPLPLPKNLVLIEMIEAKQRQDRIMREEALKAKNRRAKHREERRGGNALEEDMSGNKVSSEGCLTDDSSSSSTSCSASTQGVGLDLGVELCGTSAFAGSCGTYVVREPLGVVVLPQHPNRRRNTQNHQLVPVIERNTSPELVLQQKRNDMLLHGLEMEAEDDSLSDEKKEQQFDNTPNAMHPSPSFETPVEPRDMREPFKVEAGQKIQVVNVEDGVYQLARGVGFVVASSRQLVKVGGPQETSCKLEGMLICVQKKQQEAQKNIAHIEALANGLREKIRFELGQPEEVPVISIIERSRNDVHVTIDPDANIRPTATIASTSALGPSTPPKAIQEDTSSPGIVQPCMSADSTSVELGLTPRTPGNAPVTPYEMEGNFKYIDSPAHSCPMPSNTALDQPYIDSTPTGLPRYRVNSDEDLYGLGWAGALGCGSTLFGERLLEPSSSGNDALALSFDENSLLNDPSTRSRAAALAAAAATSGAASAFPYSGGSAGSVESPIRSGGSFDGVNFRTGMSGHRGVSAAPKRNRHVPASSVAINRPRVRMMSEHRGIAASRNAYMAPVTSVGSGSGALTRRPANDGSDS